MTSNEKSPHAQVSNLVARLGEVHVAGEGEGAVAELEEFRKEWKKEVASKRPAVPLGTSGDGKPATRKVDVNSRAVEATEDTVAPRKRPSPTTTTSLLPTSTLPLPSALPLAPAPAPVPVSPPSFRKSLPRTAAKKDDAISLYSRAVESEQSGQLNEALLLYRRAFRLDDNVDRAYARSSLHRDVSSPGGASSHASGGGEEGYSFQRHIQTAPDYDRPLPPSSAAGVTRTSPLTAILRKRDVAVDDTEFIPAEELLPVHIARLPAELIDAVLAHLSAAEIERFAVTCWRARILTANSAVWKGIALGIYRNPAIYGPKAPELASRHKGEWRTTLLEEERIRMDGCYISVCHYIRPGAGEQWVTITHMITYHRFLRFYPDGKVISFLTTDHPSDVVPLLRPSLRSKGLHFGSWRLIRSDQIDPSAAEGFLGKNDKPKAKILITDLLEPGMEAPKYEFEMELGLRETGRGRWNKLDIQRYSSINLATDETLALSLKHQKPFYFSKVLSYHPQL